MSSIHTIQNSLFTPSSSRLSARSNRAEDVPKFQIVVTNFIKLVQAALSVFGFFDVADEERDGLLCDVTLDGIQKCVQEISGLADVVVSHIHPWPRSSLTKSIAFGTRTRSRRSSEYHQRHHFDQE